MEVRGRKIGVVGLAASGRSACRLLLREGAAVFGLDANPAAEPVPGAVMRLGPHDEALLDELDGLVVSPGVPAAIPFLQKALAKGLPVIGEIHLAAQFLKAPILAITGTNGKSTTTHFLGQLVAATGARTFVGGNLGSPLCEAALAAVPPEVLVVEVSSYQMELPSGTFNPKAAVILNLTPDHLKRHGDMDGYGAMKCRLFDGMGPDQYAVVPAGDERLLRLAEGRGGTRLLLGGLPGVVRRGRTVVVETPAGSATFSLEGFAVPGEHNLDNAATAALMALLGGVPAVTIQAALPGLQALPHRMEVVADLGGVLWINDSKATNLDAAEVGMKGLDRMAVVLLGGERKGPGFGALAPFVAKHRAVVVFGGDGALISDELREAGVPHEVVPWLEEAVGLARKLAQPGDAVLLSPGCASFDQFRNFEHRGEVFRDLVARLRGSP